MTQEEKRKLLQLVGQGDKEAARRLRQIAKRLRPVIFIETDDGQTFYEMDGTPDDLRTPLTEQDVENIGKTHIILLFTGPEPELYKNDLNNISNNNKSIQNG